MFEQKQFLVASHKEVSLAGFSQREEIAVLSVRWKVRRGAPGGQFPAEKGEVSQACRKQLGHAGAKSRPEKWPPRNVSKFRY